VISAVDAFEVAARRSATLPASLPARPNPLSARAVIVAALALSICAAAESCSTPFAASMLCATVSPPLVSSVIASAASFADVAGSVISLPSAVALRLTSPITLELAPETAWSVLSELSKSAAEWMASPSPATMPAPMTPMATFVPVETFPTVPWTRLSPCTAPFTSAPTLTMSSAAVIPTVLAYLSFCASRASCAKYACHRTNSATLIRWRSSCTVMPSSLASWNENRRSASPG
jgi:hypothetical protein